MKMKEAMKTKKVKKKENKRMFYAKYFESD